MNVESALEVINSLSSGANPGTGESLPHDHVCNTAAVIRAFITAREALIRVQTIERRKRAAAPKTGTTWTVEEEGILVAKFDEGITLAVIARELQRSVPAVQARLVKLGKIEDTGHFRFPV